MASGRITLPCMPALDRNGNPVEGALLYFYENETTTPKSVYADAGLTTPLSNPVEADSAGVWPSIFADLDEVYSTAGFDPDLRTLPGSTYDFVQASIALAYPDTLTVSSYWSTVLPAVDAAASRTLLDVYSKAESRELIGLIQPVVGDNSALITAALASRTVIYFAPGNYQIDAPITIPLGKRLHLKALGDVRVYTANNIEMFSFSQGAAGADTELLMEDIWLEKSGATAATAIAFKGTSTAAGSKLYMNNCPIRNFAIGLDVAWCSGRYENAFSPFNTKLFQGTRGTAFWFLTNVTQVSGGWFAYLNDTTGGAISNGVTIVNCQNVFSQQDNDVYIRGFDATFILNCGFDLGGTGDGTGQAAILINSSTNTKIHQCYISSFYDAANPMAVAARDNRSGVEHTDSNGLTVTGNTIINNARGVYFRTTGVVTKAKATIADNDFNNNKLNGIASVGVGTGTIGAGNFFTTIAVFGTNAPVYLNTAGATGWVMTDWGCTFEQASYAITADTNSHIDVAKQTWSQALA